MNTEEVDIAQLLARVDDLEEALEGDSCGGLVDGYDDQRDQAVLVCLSIGQHVSAYDHEVTIIAPADSVVEYEIDIAGEAALLTEGEYAATPPPRREFPAKR